MARQVAFMRGLRREMGIDTIDHAGAMQLVKQHEKDNDGHLDVDERAGAHLPLAAGQFDHDDDGRLSTMETPTILARHRRDLGLTLPDQYTFRYLMSRDRDHDGELTQRKLDVLGQVIQEQARQRHHANRRFQQRWPNRFG